MAEEIKPCRICRSASHPQVQSGLQRIGPGAQFIQWVTGTLQVVCDVCGASGPRCRDDKNAAKCWNEMQL